MTGKQMAGISPKARQSFALLILLMTSCVAARDRLGRSETEYSTSGLAPRVVAAFYAPKVFVSSIATGTSANMFYNADDAYALLYLEKESSTPQAPIFETFLVPTEAFTSLLQSAKTLNMLGRDKSQRGSTAGTKADQTAVKKGPNTSTNQKPAANNSSQPSVTSQPSNAVQPGKIDRKNHRLASTIETVEYPTLVIKGNQLFALDETKAKSDVEVPVTFMGQNIGNGKFSDVLVNDWKRLPRLVNGAVMNMGDDAERLSLGAMTGQVLEAMVPQGDVHRAKELLPKLSLVMALLSQGFMGDLATRAYLRTIVYNEAKERGEFEYEPGTKSQQFTIGQNTDYSILKTNGTTVTIQRIQLYGIYELMEVSYKDALFLREVLLGKSIWTVDLDEINLGEKDLSKWMENQKSERQIIMSLDVVNELLPDLLSEIKRESFTGNRTPEQDKMIDAYNAGSDTFEPRNDLAVVVPNTRTILHLRRSLVPHYGLSYTILGVIDVPENLPFVGEVIDSIPDFGKLNTLTFSTISINGPVGALQVTIGAGGSIFPVAAASRGTMSLLGLAEAIQIDK